jgi:glycosyltransferase involved in cell wall biosynthesis
MTEASAQRYSQDENVLHVLHVAAEDNSGGAARAAYRVHRSLADLSSEFLLRSSMLVARKVTDDPTVHTIARTDAGRRAGRLVLRVAVQERRLLRSPNPVLHSTARIATLTPRRIGELDPDVILLHWLGSQTLSIAQIGRIAAQHRPVAWRLPDTWAFCGAEHYPYGDTDTRFVDGYRTDNRPDGERGADLNRRTWERKRRHWTTPIQLIAPSRWMADQAQRSALMGDWPVEVIPNPLDTGWWGGVSRAHARQQLGIPAHHRIVLFGAVGGERDPRKGADLLHRALPALATRLAGDNAHPVELLTFGGTAGVGRVGTVPVRSVGHLDDEELRLHYSAADVMVVPSRQEAFGQTASEAITCGTPVVAFDIGGLPDLIEDRYTGRLVEPFSPEALAEGIAWCIEDNGRHARLSDAARHSATKWNQHNVGARYAELLGSLTNSR